MDRLVWKLALNIMKIFLLEDHELPALAADEVRLRVRAAGVFLQETADSLLQTSSEYLREEARLTPTQVEFEQFQAQLGELKHDVERAQARLQQILNKTGTQPC